MQNKKTLQLRSGYTVSTFKIAADTKSP